MIARASIPVFVTPDPALPGRDTLLDAEDVRAVLDRRLAQGRVRIDRVERVRAKYRPGESLRVLYRVHVGERTFLVSGRMRAAGAERLFEETRGACTATDTLSAVAFDPDLRTVFWTFPNDRRLRPPSTPLEGHRLLRGRFDGRRARCVVAGYAPERAVIYRIEDETSGRAHAFLKHFAPGGARQSCAVLDALAAANQKAVEPVRVPRALDADVADDLILIEALAGSHLHALADGSLDGAFAALGSAIGRLHALHQRSDHAVEDPCGSNELLAGADVVAFARPDLADTVRALVGRLVATRPAPREAVWIHGDLNSRNWLSQGDDVALFDFDQSTRGPAGVDVGGVLAWMRARTLLGVWSPVRESQLVRRLMAGYAHHRPGLDASELRWYRAATLVLQRAVRAVARVRESQLAVLPQMLSAATADLDAMDADGHA